MGPRVRRAPHGRLRRAGRARARDYSPAWAAEVTGVPAERIVALARRYATTRPAMIVVGGSSMHKGDRRLDGRARHRLPARRSPATSASRAAASARATAAPPTARRSPASAPRTGGRPATGFRARCPCVTEAMLDGRLRVMLLLGTNMLSSYADAGRVAEALGAAGPGRVLRPVPQRHRAPLRRRGAAGDRVAGGARLQEHQHAPLPDAEGARGAGRGRGPSSGSCASWRSGSA